MKQVRWEDQEGRTFAKLIPDDALESQAEFGVLLGPPKLEGLGLPFALEIRLHNALYARELFTYNDVQRRRQDVVGALMAVLGLDAEAIIEQYRKARDSVMELTDIPTLPEVVHTKSEVQMARSRSRTTRR